MTNLEDIAGSPLFLVGLAFGLVGLLQMAAGFVVLFRREPVGFAVRLLIGLAVAAIGLAATIVSVGMRGYQALTREEVAAHITVKPSGPQRFDAQVRFPDGRSTGYVIAGDELYVDAHILKWKPIANVIGLHTAYELDRIAGRYRSVEQERTGCAPSTRWASRVRWISSSCATAAHGSRRSSTRSTVRRASCRSIARWISRCAFRRPAF